MADANRVIDEFAQLADAAATRDRLSLFARAAVASMRPDARIMRRRPVPARPRLIDRTTGSASAPLVEAMSFDGTVLLARWTSKAYQSTDGGQTWTQIFDATQWPNTASVIGIWWLGNGQLMLSTSHSDETTLSKLFVSSGYDPDNPGAITWQHKLTVDSHDRRFTGYWACNGLYEGDPTVLVSEYGTYSLETDTARFAWLSRDYGQTFEVVFDLHDHLPVEAHHAAHVHSCAYDPYRGLLWLVNGDAENSRIWWIELDKAKPGALWTELTYGGEPITFQGVTVLPLRDAVYIGSDLPPNGLWRIAFTRHDGDLRPAVVDQTDMSSQLTVIGRKFYQRAPDQSAFLAVPYTAQPAGEVPPSGVVWVVSPDGADFARYIEDERWTSNGILAAVGPDANGVLWCYGTGTIDGQTVTERIRYDVSDLKWRTVHSHALRQDYDRVLRTTFDPPGEASTPYHESLAVERLDVRVKIAFDFALADFTATNVICLVHRGVDDPNQQWSWRFNLEKVSNVWRMRLRFRPDGINEDTTNITGSGLDLPAALAAGVPKWFRVTFDPDTGSGRECKFFLSDDGESWSQFGNTVTGTASTLAATESILGVGRFGQGTQSGSLGAYDGTIYRVVLLDDIDGDPVADVDFTAQEWEIVQGQTSRFIADLAVPDACGRPWTVNYPGAQIIGRPKWVLPPHGAERRVISGSTVQQAVESIAQVLADLGLADNHVEIE